MAKPSKTDQRAESRPKGMSTETPPARAVPNPPGEPTAVKPKPKSKNKGTKAK